MFLSPKSLRQSVAVSFMALASSQAAAELPINAKGHAEWLPISGPVEKKICPEKGAPGDWFVPFDDSFAKRNIVFVTTNSCARRFMKIDPATGELLSVLSTSELLVSKPHKVMNAISAPEKWWLQGDLVPSKPQGEPNISGPAPGQSMCQIKFGNSQTLQAVPGVLVIPDATRAFYVFRRFDPSIQSEKISDTKSFDYGSAGKPFCTLEPVIIIPTEQNIASSGRGKWGSIGATGKTPSPNVEPAFLPLAIPVAAVIEEVALWALGSVAALNIGITNQRWLKDHPAVVSNNVVVIPEGGDLIAATVEMSGMTVVETSAILSASMLGPPATSPDVDEAQKKIGLSVTPLASQLSKAGSGNCTPQEHKDMENRKKLFCESPIARAFSCSKLKPQFLNMALLRVNSICARQRDEINNKCYDGGDEGHKEQARGAWNKVRNCLDVL